MVMEDDITRPNLPDQRVVPLLPTVPADLRRIQVYAKVEAVGYFEPVSLSGVAKPPAIEVHTRDARRFQASGPR